MDQPKPQSDAIVKLVNVHKAFGGHPVLSGVSFDFQRAKTTVVLGPSGCGKSVLLKHIIGLLKPDSGEIYYEGNRIDTLSERDLAPVRLQVALIFQMSALFDSMSVAENLEFPLIEHTKLNRAERAQRVAEALATVDLVGAEPKLPSELSGGQRKRVALARGLVMNPRVVLYDEPTTGLDPIRASGINELILKLQHTMGVTSIVVTHDLISARKVADSVIMLQEGKVAAHGTFSEIEQSSDRRVQDFLRGVYDSTDDRLAERVKRDEASIAAERP